MQCEEFLLLCLCRRLASTVDIMKQTRVCSSGGVIEPQAQDALLRWVAPLIRGIRMENGVVCTR